MLYSFNDCIKKYNNQYQIEKKVQEGKLYKIEKGIYSDQKQVSDLGIIAFKYPYAVFTMNSAFYYYGLTDVIPERFYLATNRNATKIHSNNIKQFFYYENILQVGITTIIYQNVKIQIYEKERMLIELIRNKNTLPFDYYKEIIESYRKIIYELDIEKIQEYILLFPKSDYIMNVIQLEVL